MCNRSRSNSLRLPAPMTNPDVQIGNSGDSARHPSSRPFFVSTTPLLTWLMVVEVTYLRSTTWAIQFHGSCRNIEKLELNRMPFRRVSLGRHCPRLWKVSGPESVRRPTSDQTCYSGKPRSGVAGYGPSLALRHSYPEPLSI